MDRLHRLGRLLQLCGEGEGKVKLCVLIIVSGLMCLVCCKVAELVDKGETSLTNTVVYCLFALSGCCFGLCAVGVIIWKFLEIAFKIVLGM